MHRRSIMGGTNLSKGHGLLNMKSSYSSHNARSIIDAISLNAFEHVNEVELGNDYDGHLAMTGQNVAHYERTNESTHAIEQSKVQNIHQAIHI